MQQHPMNEPTKTIRRSDRHDVQFPGRVKYFGPPKPRPVTLSDLSSVGCQMAPAEDLRTGAQILVKLPGLKYWPATIVWKQDDRVGVEFKNALHPLAVEEFSNYLRELDTGPSAQSA